MHDEQTEAKPERYGAEWREEMKAQSERERRGDGARELSDAEIVAEVKQLRKAMAERDWSNETPSNIANMLMNYFGQSPLFGNYHPVVKSGLFRVREALATIWCATQGKFL